MRRDQLVEETTELCLEGSTVRLDPMRAADAPALLAAASADRSSYGYTLVPATLADMEDYVATALSEQRGRWSVPFTIRRRSDGTVVGTTRFMDLARWPDDGVRTEAASPSVGEVGSTWYAASAQGTRVNPEAKYLLLHHAFEVWQMHRITLKTDARNARSRAAIEKLGARFEGVRRAHVPATDGTIRDSAYYSIVADEWPTVKAGLERRMLPGSRG